MYGTTIVKISHNHKTIIMDSLQNAYDKLLEYAKGQTELYNAVAALRNGRGLFNFHSLEKYEIYISMFKY